jgi:fluoride exporter
MATVRSRGGRLAPFNLAGKAMGLASTAAEAADGPYFQFVLDGRWGVRSVWIGAAGFAGAIARYQVEGLVSRSTKAAFPWGTLVVNLSGCFLLGLVATLLTERFLPHPQLRSALTIGFLGAYTTFSTFAYETLRLGEDGARGLALLNVALSVVVGLGVMWLGGVFGRAL